MMLAAFLLAFAWVLPVHAAETSGSCGTSASWTFEESTGTLTISGAGKMTDFEQNGENCPWNRIKSEIRRLKVGEGITEVGSYALAGCENLGQAELSKSLMKIGAGAFRGCTGLTRMELPEELLEIGAEAFRDCTGLQSLSLPGELMKTGTGAFRGCTGLQKVTAGEKLIELGDQTFYGCAALEHIELGRNLKKIGASAFQNCGSLTGVELPTGLTELGAYAFSGCGALEEISIPGSISRINAFTFDGCGRLRTVTLARSVKTIGVWAFGNCVNLERVVIPAHMEEIQDCAFNGCQRLRSVYFMGNAPGIGGHVFQLRMEDSKPYENIPGLTLYYLEGKTGWISPTWEGYPTQRHAHNNADKVTAPTCTEQGYTTHVCKDCGTVFTDRYVDALGHDFRKGVCTRCAAQDPNWGTRKNPFVDVGQKDYYYDAVLWAVDQGVTAGMDATHFAPNGTCTRAQVVAFLWRAAGKPEPSSAKNPFTDVSSGDYFYKAVLWAAENGIVYGTSTTKFSPNASCTRAQVVCFLYRYQNSPSHGTNNPFRDVKDGAYYYDAVLWAAENGVVYGTDTTHFSPDKTCTRGQVVCFLYRLLG